MSGGWLGLTLREHQCITIQTADGDIRVRRGGGGWPRVETPPQVTMLRDGLLSGGDWRLESAEGVIVVRVAAIDRVLVSAPRSVPVQRSDMRRGPREATS